MNKRILVIDDNASIHEDFKKVLGLPVQDKSISEIEEMNQDLFGVKLARAGVGFDLSFALTGNRGCLLVAEAIEAGCPFGLVFLDQYLPDLDVISIITTIWEKAPRTEIVMISTFAVDSWQAPVEELGLTSRLLFLRKPIDTLVLRQMALSLLEKYSLSEKSSNATDQLPGERERQLELALAAMTTRNRELLEINQEASTNSSKKTDYLMSMSHEIRTPLNGVLGMVELLRETELDQNQRHLIETLAESGEVLMLLLTNILDLAKIEEGKIELQYTAFSLRKCVSGVINLMEARAIQRGNRLVTKIDPAVPAQVQGDEIWMRQVLVNLLSNAIKFTNKGNISVEIEVDVETERHVMLNFVVLDSGIGIDSKDQEQLFRQFAQVGGKAGVIYDGTGLGLAVCKQLVNLMGGEIWVKSNPGEGSAFHFSIAFEIASRKEAVNKPEQDREEPDNVIVPTSENGGRVLVVEDNPTNRKVAGIHLRLAGYCPEFVTNGQEALDWLSEEKCDLILMDIQMPVMDGFEATLEIRKFLPKIPILAMTANVFQSQRDKCFAVGMNDFQAKPVRKQGFLAMIEKWIGKPDAKKQANFKTAQSQPKVKVANTDEPLEPPIYIDRAIKDFEGDRELVGIVLTEFVKITAGRIETMVRATFDRDLEVVANEVHALKGGAGNIYAERLASVAEELEKALEQNHLARISSRLVSLSREFGCLQEYLRTCGDLK